MKEEERKKMKSESCLWLVLTILLVIVNFAIGWSFICLAFTPIITGTVFVMSLMHKERKNESNDYVL